MSIKLDSMLQFHSDGAVPQVVTDSHSADPLRTLAQALDQTLVIVRDWDGKITHWTAGCERLYGWTAVDAVGQICQELLATRFPMSLEEIKQQLLRVGNWSGEVQHTRRDGSLLAIATHWALMRSAEGEPLSVIETQTDITSRSRMQRELEAANERLQSMANELARSNEDLEEFARIASHDLSAPIVSTRWLADLLASRYAGQLTEEGQKVVRQIIQGLERMASLVEGVLAHATVGRTPIGSRQAISAEEAFDSARENLRKHIEGSGAKVEREELPRVQMDPQALAQLFQNLLSNAIKYRRADVPLEVAVSARRQHSVWLFAVKDNGIGIEREWHERIFQAMQRRHGREIAGSGIGLATCKKIVTRAGGRIWVESQEGMGSTFFFTVPGPEDQANAPGTGEATARH